MKLERLVDPSNFIAFDTETHRIQPGLVVPPLVCGSVAGLHADGKASGSLLDKQGTIFGFVKLLDGKATIAMANGPYDLLVMANELSALGQDILPKIFKALEDGRIIDIQLVESLHGIALGLQGKDPRTGKKLINPETGRPGRYSLSTVCDLVLGETRAKENDRFRQSYALLENIPLAEWPADAVQYPIDDAVNTLRAALAQTGHLPNVGRHVFEPGNNVCNQCGKILETGLDYRCISKWRRKNIHDTANQVYTHFAMSLGAAYGLIVDPISVAKLKAEAAKNIVEDERPFREIGIVREDGTENQSVLKRLVAEAYGSSEPCKVCSTTVFPSGKYKGNRAPGKAPSPITNGRTLVNCDVCCGTALQLTASVPRSDKGDIAKGRDQLSESGNEILLSYAAFNEDAKILTTYVPFLEEGIIADYRLLAPEGASPEVVAEALRKCKSDIEQAIAIGARVTIPITLRPNVLLETNRTSYDGVIQLLPREGSIRECFIARPGYVYYSNDYGGIELCTWAQICLWMGIGSELAKALNNDLNVHGALGATMAGRKYEEFMLAVKAGDKVAKDFRQAAKPANFGFPGGMGPVRLVHQQRQQGPDTEHPTGPIVKKEKRIYRGLRFCLLIGGAQRCGEKMTTVYRKEPIAPTCSKCIECAERIKQDWSKQWPEAVEYFKIINRIAEQGWQKHPISNRVRGGIAFCDAANGYFQELAAQGAKDALRHVVREQYDSSYLPEDLTDRSVLYGTSRTIVFAHDELIGEARTDLAPQIAERVGAVMVRRMKEYVPDVKVTAEPTLMKRWYKAAQCVRDPNGRLLVWEPKKV